MRIHIDLDDQLLEELDREVERGNRSKFVREAIRSALDAGRRWQLLEASAGSISDTGHDWDEDPAAWVAQQRRLDPRRVG